MSNYLITGVSSGIGRELTKRLIQSGHKVFGVARRKPLLLSLKKELNNSSKFIFIESDFTREDAWKDILKHIQAKKFSPHAVIFNAAIFEKDYLGKHLDVSLMRKMFEVNFFSIINGFEEIIKITKPNTQFIFISSSSALKGSGAEGIGYPTSKAALSIAFESLYQKYKGKYRLKIIYFGPIDTDMLPSRSRLTPVLSKQDAVEKIIQVLNSRKLITFTPWYLFVFLRMIKFLPDYVYLTILHLVDILHLKSSKK